MNMNEKLNRPIYINILSERTYMKKHHVSYDTILGLEDEFATSEGVQIVHLSTTIRKLNRVVNKVFKRRLPDITVKRKKNVVYFYTAMGIGDLQVQAETLQYLKKQGCIVAIYCFDTWETKYNAWMKIFEYINPNYIFLAYEQSAQYFAEKLSNVYFLPQSMDKRYFYDRNIKKTRLFMQMGRRNEAIHKMILQYLYHNRIEDEEKNYVYERKKGRIIFPNTDELARNINATKYFVCAPQSIENKKLTGNVSDITARFYEAMACKALIIGFKPEPVFDELFPNDAMITLKADGSDFDNIISFYESHPEEYKRIVERNYDLVMSRHSWTNRLKTIQQILQIYI